MPMEAASEPAVPFWYWGLVYFVFGTMFGSLANVCIHRMPLGQSIITPRSHCPNCGYMIPWFHNIPLVTWLQLKGRCASCGVAISPRYFLVELLTGMAFLSCWLGYGAKSPAVAAVLCVLIYGFIIATFIDLEHFIIPDEITLGGIVVGFLCATAVPMLFDTSSRPEAMRASALGIAVGGGVVYAIVRGGKLLFGQRHLELEPSSKLIFTETHLHLPQETLPYEEIFYRQSDTVVFHARQIEMIDRGYRDVNVRLNPAELRVGDDTYKPDQVHQMEVVTDAVVLPREAMGFGDVKFMAAIGAFVGWQGVLFTLMVSALLGSVVGVSGILLGRKDWSSRIPYGPYIAAAATLWIFFGAELTGAWFAILDSIIGPRPFPAGA